MTGSAPSHKQWPVAMRDAVWRHLSELANAAGMSPDGKVSERVSKLAGRDKVHTLNAGFSENPITFQCASFRSQRVTPSSAPPSTVTHADERAAAVQVPPFGDCCGATRLAKPVRVAA